MAKLAETCSKVQKISEEIKSFVMLDGLLLYPLYVLSQPDVYNNG
jgi:hypothetical protein